MHILEEITGWLEFWRIVVRGNKFDLIREQVTALVDPGNDDFNIGSERMFLHIKTQGSRLYFVAGF